MKRKLFSAILFGALLTASTSGLTSCKDYDDDISNLQSQIDKLATKEELQSKAKDLEDKINAAQNAANAASDVAKDAAAAAKAAATKDDVEAAKKAAIEAGQAAADKALKAANDAQAAADKNADDLKKAAEGATKAVEEIQTAMKGLATTEAVTAAVKEVADKYDAQAEDLKALSDRLAKVEAKLGLGEGGEDIDLTEIQAELEDIEDAFEALVGVVSDMVTSVELVYSSAHDAANNLLNFQIVTEQKNETFGKDVADKILTTAKDYTRFEGDDVIIRVNPVDAEITAEDVALINSKGEEISDVVKAIKVERYSSNDYMTRSTGNNTGLWKVTYAPVEGQKANDLKKKFVVNQGTSYAANNYIAYAVSVKSAISDSISANRRVVSAYDVAMQLTDFNPYVANLPGYSGLAAADTVEIKVNGNWLKTLKNRNNSGLQASSAKEYIWNTTEPSNEVKTASPANVMPGDQRWSTGKYLIARVGEDIKIKFTQKIKGFYVRLDYDWVEQNSAPSELNAWNSYKYVNVGTQSVAATMFEGNEGTIKVSELSGQATGDVIGFRIYAMNLDGTLVDPDGMAFYVNLGDTGINADLGAKDLLVKSPSSNQSGAYSVEAGTFTDITDVVWSVKNGSDAVAVTENSDYTVEYYDSKANAWTAFGSIANKDKVTAVRFNIKAPTEFKDNATFTFNAVLKANSSQGTSYEKSYLSAKLTKKLPDSAPAYQWNEGQTEEQIVKPSGYDSSIETAMAITSPTGAVVAADLSNLTKKDGNLNFNDMFIQSASGNPSITSDGKFIFYLAKTVWNRDNNAWSDALKVTTPYDATINNALIDCSTPHAVSTEYNYGAISTETFQNRPAGQEHDWIVNTTSGYNIKYMTWSYKDSNYLGFKWATKNVAAADKPADYREYDNNKIEETIEIATGRIATVYGSKLTTGLRKATLKDYLNAEWLKIADVQTVGVTSGTANPYYEFDRTSTTVDKIVLKRKAGTQNVPVHSEKVIIKVADCYGHTETYEFVLKLKNEDAYPSFTYPAP